MRSDQIFHTFKVIVFLLFSFSIYQLFIARPYNRIFYLYLSQFSVFLAWLIQTHSRGRRR